jgi:surfactin synthase thioesterase subunit
VAAAVTPARSGWVVGPRSHSPGRLRLFCFPSAGGAASAFRSWAGSLPPGVELCPIQLPGRGARFHEPPFRRLPELVGAAAGALQPLLDKPFALFGHSMGAVVAFELARELRRRAWPEPGLVVVSGHEAPQRPNPDPPLAHLPDAEFVEEICRRYDGIPKEVLDEHELLQLMIPVLRADIMALESYAYRPEAPLECALSCFGGAADRHVSREDLEAWSEQTRGSFRIRTFDGGHFFLETARAGFLAALREDLAAMDPERARPGDLNTE